MSLKMLLSLILRNKAGAISDPRSRAFVFTVTLNDNAPTLQTVKINSLRALDLTRRSRRNAKKIFRSPRGNPKRKAHSIYSPGLQLAISLDVSARSISSFNDLVS